MPSPSQLLRMEALERRDVPAAQPWADVSALTLSFAPDLTAVGRQYSGLSSLMWRTGSAAAWQTEILRAYQTWAVQTNGNIAVVKDDRSAFGSSGDLQGDNRFGDIRVGAVGLSADTVASASPPDPRLGTWSGDVLFNTNKSFAIGPKASSRAYDLFTVALHEAGHSLGLDHTSDPNAVLAEGYRGARSELTAGDVAALRALYGSRQADEYEGANGNGTFATATALPPAAFREVVADLSAVGDMDTFAFTVPAGADKPVVRLRTAGVSSAVARVEVFDAAGKLVSATATTDPLDPKELSLKLPALRTSAQYFARVSSPVTDAFAVGRYVLTLNLDSVKASGAGKPVEDKGTNETVGTATALAPWSSGNANRYRIDAKLEDRKDRDVYRLSAPTAAAADAMRIEVRNLRGDKVPPVVRVFDAAGMEYTAQVLESSASKTTLQVLGIERGATYFVALASPDKVDATGDYRLTAEFGDPAAGDLDQLDTGAVSSALPEVDGTLVVSSAGLYNFELAVAGAMSNAKVELQVFDSLGLLVASWEVDPATGQTAGSVFLKAGRYRVTVALEAKRGQTVAPIRYWLFGGESSDPIGPTATTTGTLAGTSSGSTTGSGSTTNYTSTPTTTSSKPSLLKVVSPLLGIAYKS